MGRAHHCVRNNRRTFPDAAARVQGTRFIGVIALLSTGRFHVTKDVVGPKDIVG